MESRGGVIASAANSAGHLLHLIRTGQARTRTDLQRLAGLSRSTVAQRIDTLISADYLRQSGLDESTGGRPSILLDFNDRHRMVLTAGLGATQASLALLDLAGHTLAERRGDQQIAAGPQPVLDWVAEQFRDMLKETGLRPADICGIGLGVPGPVEFQTGRVRQPPIMPGWDDYPIAEHLGDLCDGPVLVDNDANLMALGEYLAHYSHCTALVLVKVATGIGAGMVIDGSVYRGVDGGAGDIGHIRLHGYDDTRCMCGAHGCLAAVASGGALAQRLTALGVPTANSRELVSRIADGDPDAARLAREAGQLVGEVLATVVCLINPEVLIIAGDMAETHFLTGVREVLYQRALPRATRHLQVTTGQLRRASVLGAHAMVVDTVYAPAAVDALLLERTGS
jgi:predicted NBD/HSP70 family sugar kinase